MYNEKRVIGRKIYYDIDILEIPCKKKHFIEYGIAAIAGLTIAVLSIVLTFVFLKDDIVYIFSFIGVLSTLFVALPFVPMFIFWGPSDEKIGHLNDFTIEFMIIEGRDILGYSFMIEEIKNITRKNIRTLIIQTKNKRTFILPKIRNARMIVKTFKRIKRK